MKLKRLVMCGFLCFAVLLVGCTEVLSIPSVSVKSDGSEMAFLVQADSGESLHLQTLNLNDGTIQRIGDPENMQGAFDWNPANDTIAFVEITQNQETNIQLTDLTPSTTSETLLTLPDNTWVNQISISPDGAYMALSLSGLPPETAPRDLLDSSVDLNGTGIQVMLVDLASEVINEIARDDEAGDTPSLDWNSAGTRLVYAYGGRAFVYDAAEGASSGVNWMQDQSLRSPSWLNDTTLVMVSSLEDSEGNPIQPEVVTFDVTTSATQSWAISANVAVVSASPDGRMIAYIEGQRSPDPASSGGYATTTTSVVLLTIDQASREAVFVGESLDRPVWSPDSQTLYISNANAFSMFAGNRRQIFALDIASGAVTPLFEAPLATSSLLGWFPPEEAAQ